MKKRVHYAIMEDMKKYINGINIKDYEVNGDFTDPSIIEFVRHYYANHLPVDITAWARVNKPDKNLIYGDGLAVQVCFIRDVLCELLSKNWKYWEKNPPMVISTHISKSIKLPVYYINLKEYGIEMVLRNNFYDWKVSIKSEKTLEYDFMELFNPSLVIEEVLCEGFPKEKIYGSYEQDCSKFTIELKSDYDLYTFVFLLKNYLKIR